MNGGPQYPGDDWGEDEDGAPDLLAEQAVLGAMMLNPQIADRMARALRVEDFWRGSHQIVFATLVEMREARLGVDALSVHAELARRGLIGRAGGANGVHDLLACGVPSAADRNARIVRDRAVLRALTVAGQRITQAGRRSALEDLDATLDLARSELDQVIVRAGTDQTAVQVADLLDAALERVEKPEQGRVIRTGVSPDLDDLFTGLEPGRLTILGARPSIGKSTVGRGLCKGAANNGTPSLLVSLEMGRDEIMQSLLADEAQVPLHHIKAGTCGDYEWSKLAQAASRLAQLPMWIDDTPTMTVAEFRHRAARAKREHGVGLVCLDYLQLLVAPKAESRQVAVSMMSRDLKLLSRSEDLAVLALSQLNRGPEGRADKTPQMADLRESGSQEQDADNVLLLHREDAYERDSPRAGEMDVIVAKQRSGPRSTVTVVFQGHYARIVGFASDDARGAAA